MAHAPHKRRTVAMAGRSGVSYGTDAQVARELVWPDTHGRVRQAMQRRVAIFAALLALASLAFLSVTRLNPESSAERARQDQHFTVLAKTFMAMVRACTPWCEPPARQAARTTARFDSGPDSRHTGAKRRQSGGTMDARRPAAAATATETLLQEPGRATGRREMLSDVFMAPLDVASGALLRALTPEASAAAHDRRQVLARGGVVGKAASTGMPDQGFPTTVCGLRPSYCTQIHAHTRAPAANMYVHARTHSSSAPRLMAAARRQAAP